MYKPQISMPLLHRSTIPALFLVMDWFAGLSLGFYAARFYGVMLASLIMQSASCVGSPIGMLVTTMLPLLLSAFAVFLFDSRLIWALCLVRGVGLGLMLGAVCRASPGGLLLGVLLLFSALFFTPVLMWYWLRRICRWGSERRDMLIALGWGLLIWIVDQTVIAPFLAYAINL